MPAFRTISINSRCKLEVQLDYLIVRGENEIKILMDEISTLIISNTQCSMTAAALSRLMEHKVKIIFCDSQWNPQGELIGYHDYYAPFLSLKKQLDWKQETKANVWKEIVKAKLIRQSKVLSYGKNRIISTLLLEYADAVEPDDTTNREGAGAKQYFDALFGLDFNRRYGGNIQNTFLNYGYSIILSAVNRELSASGYLLQLGIHHRGETNPFNFGCDLVEPLRPFIDFMVKYKNINEDNYKKELVKILQIEVGWAGKTCIMDNAIHNYVKSILNALETDSPEKCQFAYPLDY